MLTLAYAQDVNSLTNAYALLGVEDSPVGCNFLFLDDGEVVGLMRIKFEDCAVVDLVRFANGVEIGDKIFFIHAILYKLKIGAPVRLFVRGLHEELKPYGFVEDGDGMSIVTNEINLHGNCKGKC